jgi:hypothetical protein
MVSSRVLLLVALIVSVYAADNTTNVTQLKADVVAYPD